MEIDGSEVRRPSPARQEFVFVCLPVPRTDAYLLAGTIGGQKANGRPLKRGSKKRGRQEERGEGFRRSAQALKERKIDRVLESIGCG
jgi:hypothetical protein